MLINAGDATVKGMELEGTAAPTDDWNIRFGVNYMPTAKYDEFENCPGPVPGAGYDCSGSRIISSPKWDVTLGTDYTIDTSVGDFNLALTYQYQSESPWDADHGLFPVYEEDSRSIVNLRGEWRPDEGDIYLAAYVRNLTDEEYEIAGTNANGAGERGMPGAPRTYGGTVGYNY